MPRFPAKSYDVTNFIESGSSVCCVGWTTKTLSMEEEEVVLKTRNCCLNQAQRRPYAQLNTVDLRTQCFNICYAISSDLAPVDVEGNGGIVPGCGCDELKVKEIIDELNVRKNGRGNIAQIRQQTFMLDKVNRLKLQIPVLLDAFKVAYPPDEATIQRIWGNAPPAEFRALRDVLGGSEALQEFDTKEYDVTCCIEPLCCTSKKLILGPEELVVTKIAGLTRDTVTEHRPYANVDSVEATKACFCCSGVSFADATGGGAASELSNVMPGTGCNAGLVEEIRAELQARVGARGQVGQMAQLEKMMQTVNDLSAELPLLLDKQGLEVAYPPSQQTMSDLYGPGAPQQPPIPPPHDTTSISFPEKTYDVQNTCGAVCGCLCTCGIAGCTKTTMILKEEEIQTELSNNCTQSVNRTPYAQLGGVSQSTCCGLHSVNGMMPGLGCSADVVKEIADELQERKVKRGNIAQLRNQENTMYKAVEMDVRTDILMKKLAVAYPPEQDTMNQLYGANPPSLPSNEAERGSGIHIQASERLGTRSWTTTNWADMVCCCCTQTSLTVDDEEFVVERVGPLCTGKDRRPYAQMGSVEKTDACCCCRNVTTDTQIFSPGCGCATDLVEDIGNELQFRKVTRGNIAQIKQQENLMIELIKLGVKLDLITKDRPNCQVPPSQETMDRMFGPGAQVPEPAEQTLRTSVVRRGSSFTTMEVVVPEGATGGSQFTVKGPRGSFQAEVPVGAMANERIVVPVPGPSSAAAPLLQATELSSSMGVSNRASENES